MYSRPLTRERRLCWRSYINTSKEDAADWRVPSYRIKSISLRSRNAINHYPDSRNSPASGDERFFFMSTVEFASTPPTDDPGPEAIRSGTSHLFKNSLSLHMSQGDFATLPVTDAVERRREARVPTCPVTSDSSRLPPTLQRRLVLTLPPVDRGCSAADERVCVHVHVAMDGWAGEIVGDNKLKKERETAAAQPVGRSTRVPKGDADGAVMGEIKLREWEGEAREGGGRHTRNEMSGR
ncbi:hypothetical protein C8J57DRAFT_1210344 [Mycena rebaudengoi]|nr:hypothetical protein C8J57DRAFT_1210344 [Mycena rebaudengoi]